MLNTLDLDPKGNRAWNVSTPPAVEPITLEEVKLFGRIDGSDEDTLITSIITGVRQKVELYLNRALIEQTITLIMDWWNTFEILLPQPPLLSITKVETIDEDDVATEYAATNYYADRESIPGRLIIKRGSTLPTNTDRLAGGFKITYKAGYGSTASYVDTIIKNAMKEWAVLQYENRVFDEELPDEVKKNLRLLRVPHL
jgi:uncharacterized phiE125 gp8 family phage protein